MNTPSPAPWRIGSEYDNRRDEIEDAEGRTIATVWTRSAISGASARPQFTDCPKGKANLRLMVAAPKLLAVVQRLFHSVNGFSATFSAVNTDYACSQLRKEITETIREAQKALAEATTP